MVNYKLGAAFAGFARYSLQDVQIDIFYILDQSECELRWYHELFVLMQDKELLLYSAKPIFKKSVKLIFNFKLLLKELDLMRNVFDVLQERGFIAQITHPEEVKKTFR